MAIRWSRWSPQLALTPAVLVTLIAFFGSIGWTIFISLTRSRRSTPGSQASHGATARG